MEEATADLLFRYLSRRFVKSNKSRGARSRAVQRRAIVPKDGDVNPRSMRLMYSGDSPDFSARSSCVKSQRLRADLTRRPNSACSFLASIKRRIMDSGYGIHETRVRVLMG